MTGVVTRATKGVPLTATDHDNNLEVTVSLHKSATEPSPTYACMLWADTNNDLLKMRNKANDAWITMGALDTTGAFSDNNLADQDQLSELSDVTITSVADNEVLAYDSTSSEWINQTASEAGLATSAQGSLADSALQDGDTVSSLTITSADINGGTVDGITSLTQTNVAADATDVELKYSGSTKLATTSTGIDVTGTVTAENGSALITDNAIDIEPYGGGSSQGGLGAVAGGVVAVNGNNQLRINTQSTRRAQFDSNGDISFYEDTGTTAKFFWDASAESLGIGTSSPLRTLHVSGAGDTGLMLQTTNAVNDKEIWEIQVAGNASNYADLIFRTRTNAGTGGTEAMRIDSSGNVGIGTTSPTQRLQVDGGAVRITGNYGSIANNQGLMLGYTGDNANYYAVGANGGGVGQHVFYGYNYSTGSGSERMRIDSSGNLLVGTTSTHGGARVSINTQSTAGNAGFSVQNSVGTSLFLVYNNGYFTTGTASNSPYNNTTASAANVYIDNLGGLLRSTSSLKYKKDVQDAWFGLEQVLKLRPVTYKGKSENDGDKVFGGLIAEEVDAIGLEEFVQYASDGTPDALAYGHMVSLLAKAIQEQQAIIEALETRIAALESN